jgi:hypothetical protein
MLRLSLVHLVAAGILGFLAVREWRIRAAENAPPQDLPLQELFVRGAQGPPHVSLRSFEFDGRFAYDPGPLGEPWRAVWIPIHTPTPVRQPAESPDLARGAQRLDSDVPSVRLVPGSGEGRIAGRDSRETRAIHALLLVRGLRSAEDVQHFAERRTLSGHVLEDSSALDERDVDLLRDKFPGLNFSKCMFIEVNRPPRGLWRLLLYGLGAIVSLAGSGWFLRAWLKRPRAPVQRSISEEAEEAIEAWQEALDKRKPGLGGYE